MRKITPFVLLFLAGCVVTSTDIVKTGLLEDDVKALSGAYEKVDKMKRWEATRKEVEEVGGFKFELPNIRRLSKRKAFEAIFGGDVFQGAIKEAQQIRGLLEEVDRYSGFSIPYKNIIILRDRFYFSRKDIHKKGDDLLILILFRKDDNGVDRLAFCDFDYVKIDSHLSESAFAEGVIEALGKYGGLGSDIKQLTDKIRERLRNND